MGHRVFEYMLSAVISVPQRFTFFSRWGPAVPSPSQQVIAARFAIALMAIVLAIEFIAGLSAEPCKPRDAIAVTTACALFFVVPGCGIAAGLALWRIPPRRPLLS